MGAQAEMVWPSSAHAVIFLRPTRCSVASASTSASQLATTPSTPRPSSRAPVRRRWRKPTCRIGLLLPRPTSKSQSELLTRHLEEEEDEDQVAEQEEEEEAGATTAIATNRTALALVGRVSNSARGAGRNEASTAMLGSMNVAWRHG